MKTFSNIMADYNEQYRRNIESYNKDKTSIPINYGQIGDDLISAIEAEGFSKAQAGYIYGCAYANHHSSFGDVIIYSQDYCDWFKNFPK